jgi:hypothetical protein
LILDAQRNEVSSNYLRAIFNNKNVQVLPFLKGWIRSKFCDVSDAGSRDIP